MTRKARLQAWAAQLNAPVPADATAAELEQAIEVALANPVIPEPDCPGLNNAGCPWMADDSDIPQYSLGEGIANNARVVREELPSVVKAVVANLFG